MATRRPTRSLTTKLDAELVDRLRRFVRDQRGQPLFLTVNGLVGLAVERELERQALILAGALPRDRMIGQPDSDEPPPTPPAHAPRRRINAR